MTFEKAFALIQARSAGPSASCKDAHSADEQLFLYGLAASIQLV